MKSAAFMCFFFWGLTGFVFTEKKSEKKFVRPTVEKALNVLKGQTEESMMVLLKSQVSAQDAEFVKKQLRRLNVNLKASLAVQIVDKNVLVWDKQRFIVRNNGKEIQYKTHIFRLNKNDSLEKNMTHFAKKMMSKTAVSSFSLVPKAHAKGNDFGDPRERREITLSALNVARALTHLGIYLQWDGQQYRFNAEVFQNSTLFDLLKNSARIRRITCQNIDLPEGRIRIEYKSGQVVSLKRIAGENGASNRFRSEFENGSLKGEWKAQELNSDFQEDVSHAMSYFCRQDETARNKMLNALQDIQDDVLGVIDPTAISQ